MQCYFSCDFFSYSFSFFDFSVIFSFSYIIQSQNTIKSNIHRQMHFDRILEYLCVHCKLQQLILTCLAFSCPRSKAWPHYERVVWLVSPWLCILVQCVSSPLKNVDHPCCFRSVSCARSWCCSKVALSASLTSFSLYVQNTLLTSLHWIQKIPWHSSNLCLLTQ